MAGRTRRWAEQRGVGSSPPTCSALLSHFLWPFSEELKMTALAALQSIPLDEKGLVSCAKRAMSMPLEAITPAMGANDWLATSLKLTRTECLFHCHFNPAFNCCDRFVHNGVDAVERWRSLTGDLTPGAGMGSWEGNASGGPISHYGL